MVELENFRTKVKAQWYNPVTGKFIPASAPELANKGPYTFSTPGDNGSGTNDWILLLQSK